MFHTFDICERVAEKLKDPDQILDIIVKNEARYSDAWFEVSLGYGWSSLALFYSVLSRFFPNEKYDHIAHTYLKLSISKLQSLDSFPISLFQGISGICFAAYFCSRSEERYEQLMIQLDDFLMKKLDEHFVLLETQPFPHGYSLAQGISGVLAYLSLKQNNPMLLQAAKKCLSILVQLMSRQTVVLGCSMPGWYEPESFLIFPQDKEKYPNGKFTIGMLYGISGILSALSIAASEGIWVEGLRETISSLAQWLKTKKKDSPCGPIWPDTVSFEEEMGEGENYPLSPRDAWEGGIPSIARSLYLASKALNQESLKVFAEDVFLQIFSKNGRDWNLKGSSFMLGKAGLLAMAYWMSQDTRNPLLFKKVSDLECDLKRSFNPLLPFGFQTPDGRNEPGIMEGSAGIVLSLLLAQGREESRWDRMFLLR